MIVAEKYWMIHKPVNDGKLQRFNTYDEAVAEAQRQTKELPVDILELVARTEVPVPDIKVKKVVA